MPVRPLQERLDELARRRAQVDAEIAALNARARQDAKKDEDRIKFLLGTLVWDRMAEEPDLQAFVERELPARLTARDRDRGLWEQLFPEEADGGSAATGGADGSPGVDGTGALHGADGTGASGGSDGTVADPSGSASDVGGGLASPRAEG